MRHPQQLMGHYSSAQVPKNQRQPRAHRHVRDHQDIPVSLPLLPLAFGVWDINPGIFFKLECPVHKGKNQQTDASRVVPVFPSLVNVIQTSVSPEESKNCEAPFCLSKRTGTTLHLN